MQIYLPIAEVSVNAFLLLGLGGLQVGITTLIIASAFIMLSTDSNFGTALVIGMALSLSSTAVAIQVMQDRKMLMSESGQSAFSVLLFQDVIVIAMIAAVPVLAEQFVNHPSAIAADVSNGHQSAGGDGLSAPLWLNVLP